MTYWHIQMNQPWGRNGGKIDSALLLNETPSVIGTGEWEDSQCAFFKDTDRYGRGMKIGDVVLVHEGKNPIALCKVTGNNFNDDALTAKYAHENFRAVNVLDWYRGNEIFNKVQGTLERLINSNESKTFIENWYKKYLRANAMTKIEEIVKHKGQIILQGPPGTGKTVTAKDVAEKLITGTVSETKAHQQAKFLEFQEQFKLIQFHPAYSYEDFVRGITAKATVDGIVYETENKTLAQFALDALDNWRASKKDVQTLNLESWVINELIEFGRHILFDISANGRYALNDNFSIIGVADDAFAYKHNGKNVKNPHYMKFRDICLAYTHNVQERNDIKKIEEYSGRGKDHCTYDLLLLNKFRAFLINRPAFVDPHTANLVQLKNYVLVIDEINRANLPAVLGELIYALEYRGEPVSSMYAIDEDRVLILPPNLYVIGTMNTADRSVGHIDYAIRRRFAFVPILPSDSVIDKVITNNATLLMQAKRLYQKVAAFFSPALLMGDFKQEDVQLGHSYFLAKTKEELELKLEYEIKPLLREYLKDGVLKSVRRDSDNKDQTEIDIDNLKVE